MTVQFCPHRRFGGRRDISENGFLAIPTELADEVPFEPVLWIENDGTLWQLAVPPGDGSPIVVMGNVDLIYQLPDMIEDGLKLKFLRSEVPCEIATMELDTEPIE